MGQLCPDRARSGDHGAHPRTTWRPRIRSASVPFRILRRYILPNTISPIIVVASFSMAQAILTEAALSFLGVGVDSATPSWGTMLNDGRNYLQDAWWIATMPGIATALAVLGRQLCGDWLRDHLDPRLAPMTARRCSSVEDLEVAFDASAIACPRSAGVSFTIAAGEAVGIVGESGSGKSVAMIAVMRLLDRPAGTIVELGG